ARDRGCLRCGQKPRFCHAHHIVGWASGGLTDLENLCLLCPRCHRDLHLGHYQITTSGGSAPVITVTAPPGRQRP
ncbi:MAG: HNH endonuclease, partial [Candidatus Nanopelagicales bacterium]|nr:HNH endonuclease [Candidatus Nanopelagicales bacterium]